MTGNPDTERFLGGLLWVPNFGSISEPFLAALNVAGFITGTFLQQSPPSKESVFFNAGLTYRF